MKGMKMTRYFLAGTMLLLLFLVQGCGSKSGDTEPKQQLSELDKLYGVLSKPAYMKHYEVNKKDEFWITPFLQVANKQTPGVLDPKSKEPYNWNIDDAGNVRITIESRNPYGRPYKDGAVRPEDKSRRKPGWTEKDGHVTLLAGEPGRIGGELNYNKKNNTWEINNKSGRYSNHNVDRTPEQLMNAVKLIQAVVDPGDAKWGEVQYLVRYSPEKMRPEFLARKDIKYGRPDAKGDIIQKDPYLVLK